MKYFRMVIVTFSVLFLTQCISSNGKFCLWGMRSGSTYGDPTWGTVERVPLTSSELKIYTEISQQKIDSYVIEIYSIADLYCINGDDFVPDEQSKIKVRGLATIYVNGSGSITQIKDLRYALKENITPLMFVKVLETAGLYKGEMLDYCNKNKRVKVPNELQQTLFSHYMYENGFIWFGPEKPARMCKSVLG